MFGMSASGQYAYARICKGCSRKHAPVLFFFKMRKYQPLPVLIQYILTAHAAKAKTAAALCRFQKQMHFRIMPERLKMSYSFNRVCDGLFIYHPAFTEFYLHGKPVMHVALKHLKLHFTHDLCAYLVMLFIKADDKLWIFFLDDAKILKKCRTVSPVHSLYAVSQYRLKIQTVAVF